MSALFSRLLDALFGPPVWVVTIEDGFFFAEREDQVADDAVMVGEIVRFRSHEAARKEAARRRLKALENPTPVI
jgi:hypothetical protein